MFAIASIVTRLALITAPVTLAEASGWFFLACAPAAAFLFIARRSTAPTVADLLRAGTHVHDRQTPSAAEAHDIARRR